MDKSWMCGLRCLYIHIYEGETVSRKKVDNSEGPRHSKFEPVSSGYFQTVFMKVEELI
jgi:hypothetical protein